MKKPKVKQIGQILIEKNLLTEQKLSQALETQAKEGGLLGNILVKLGYVTQKDIENCIEEQDAKSAKIEEVLSDLGMISREQFNEALSIQKKEGGALSQIIINAKYISEEDFVAILVTQCGLPYLQLNNYEVDKEILKLIPKDIAREFKVIPIDKIGDILTVAMADPLNNTAVEKIRKITSLSVEKFISTFSEINNAISQYYA